MSASNSARLHVVGVALARGGRCLVAQRAEGAEAGLCWEFPGGKVEPGEEARAALQRELVEELGVVVSVGEFLGRGEAEQGTRHIVLDVFSGQLMVGEPRALEHHELRWCAPDELGELEWAAADVPIVPRVERWLRAQAHQP